jgi:hypothetical protein
MPCLADPECVGPGIRGMTGLVVSRRAGEAGASRGRAISMRILATRDSLRLHIGTPVSHGGDGDLRCFGVCAVSNSRQTTTLNVLSRNNYVYEWRSVRPRLDRPCHHRTELGKYREPPHRLGICLDHASGSSTNSQSIPSELSAIPVKPESFLASRSMVRHGGRCGDMHGRPI